MFDSILLIVAEFRPSMMIAEVDTPLPCHERFTCWGGTLATWLGVHSFDRRRCMAPRPKRLSWSVTCSKASGAGDEARARGALRMAIPALYRVLDEDRWHGLVTLDAGTADRPRIKEDFIDLAIEAGAAKNSDPEVRARAAELGSTLDDRALFALASDVIRSAQDLSA
jgi:hypothetical protein